MREVDLCCESCLRWILTLRNTQVRDIVVSSLPPTFQRFGHVRFYRSSFVHDFHFCVVMFVMVHDVL